MNLVNRLAARRVLVIINRRWATLQYALLGSSFCMNMQASRVYFSTKILEACSHWHQLLKLPVVYASIQVADNSFVDRSDRHPL